jgi:hypothetical protein
VRDDERRGRAEAPGHERDDRHQDEDAEDLRDRDPRHVGARPLRGDEDIGERSRDRSE